MPDTTTTTHGDAPIEFAGYMDGYLVVQHLANPSPNSPFHPRRVALFVGLGTFPAKGEHLEIVATLDDAMLDDLIARLTAARDQPRLEARRIPTLVAQDDAEGYRLLRTPFEWGVLWQDNEDDPDDGEAWWFDGKDAEQKARASYAEQRSKVICEDCDVETDEDTAISDGDGNSLCEACANGRDEVFRVTAYAHTEGCPGGAIDGKPCEWRGKGADGVWFECGESDALCPKCDQPVEEIHATTAEG